MPHHVEAVSLCLVIPERSAPDGTPEAFAEVRLDTATVERLLSLRRGFDPRRVEAEQNVMADAFEGLIAWTADPPDAPIEDDAFLEVLRDMIRSWRPVLASEAYVRHLTSSADVVEVHSPMVKTGTEGRFFDFLPSRDLPDAIYTVDVFDQDLYTALVHLLPEPDLTERLEEIAQREPHVVRRLLAGESRVHGLEPRPVPDGLRPEHLTPLLESDNRVLREQAIMATKHLASRPRDPSPGRPNALGR